MGLRQRDVGRMARVSQSAVSRVERGHLAWIRWPDVERVCSVLEIRLQIRADWRGSDGAQLLDREHAAIVELVTRDLAAYSWESIVEFGFNHYGDRGSVDVVGWHPGERAVLLVEVKTEIADVQDLMSSMDRKERVVPKLLTIERGWTPTAVGRLLVVRGSHSVRSIIERHSVTFTSMLPDRTVACRRWLRRPAGRLAGIMFVSESRLSTVMRGPGRVRRVRA